MSAARYIFGGRKTIAVGGPAIDPQIFVLSFLSGLSRRTADYMEKAKSKVRDFGLRILDLALTCGAFGLAMVFVARRSHSLAYFLEIRIKVQNILVFLALVLLWHVVYSLCGLYESKRLASQRSEVVDTVKAVTLATICLFAATLLFGLRMVTTNFVIIFWGLTAVSCIAVRVVLRYALRTFRARGRNTHFMLILGTNQRAVEFVTRIQANPELGYRILGFIDDEWKGNDVVIPTGYRLLCDLDHLSDFLRRNVVDEVAIYLPLRSMYGRAYEVASLCELHGIIMRVESDIFNLKIAKAWAEDFGGDALITTSGGPFEGWRFVVKRILDFSGALVLLVLLSPVFLAIAILIKFTSPGSILFAQERVGLNKRRFQMYKFRTMVPGAERMIDQLLDRNEVSGPVFKIKNDPRITHLGKSLRKTSLDELPQLFNVLKGDMSLVGPRPMAVRDFEGFREDWQRRRFSVHPGITCLWQVNGRSLIPFEKWMELDMQYVDEWSLWLDLKILARTLPAILKGWGAI